MKPYKYNRNQDIDICFIGGIDLKLLKQQKMAVLNSNIAKKEKDGLLELLDYIQDALDYAALRYR